MIQGSIEPTGNAGEPLPFTVVTCCAGAAQPCLNYPPPPPPRLFRFLNLPQTASPPVQAAGLTSAAPANRRAIPSCGRHGRDSCRCHSASRTVPSSSGRGGLSPFRQAPVPASLKLGPPHRLGLLARPPRNPSPEASMEAGSVAARTSCDGNANLERLRRRFRMSLDLADCAGVGV